MQELLVPIENMGIETMMGTYGSIHVKRQNGMHYIIYPQYSPGCRRWSLLVKVNSSSYKGKKISRKEAKEIIQAGTPCEMTYASCAEALDESFDKIQQSAP